MSSLQADPITKLHYAVLALTKTEVEKVIKLGINNIITNWLEEHKSRYGNSPGNWKPFGEDEIEMIIEEKNKYYYKATDLTMCYLDGDPVDISTINVFFIDLFSFYLPPYQSLACRSDMHFCSAIYNKCCFLLDYTLPDNVQEELLKNYKNHWKDVSKKYSEGYLHRVAARIDDLTNFRDYLITLSNDRPNLRIKASVDNELGGDTDKDIPRLYGGGTL